MKVIRKFFLGLVLSSIVLMSMASANDIDAVSLFSASKNASPKDTEELENENGSTPYDTITHWYESAKSVPFSEVRNTVYEGRCFHPHGKKTPVKGGVIFKSRKLEDNSGPAFPPEVENKVFIAEFYTTVSKQEMMNFMDKNWSEAKITLNSHSPLMYGQQNIEGEVKLFENYYVTLFFTTKKIKCKSDFDDYYKDVCARNKGILPIGTSVGACYFYKKLN